MPWAKPSTEFGKWLRQSASRAREALPPGGFPKSSANRSLTRLNNVAILLLGRVPLPVGRAGFKPVGGRSRVLGRFDSCLFRQPPSVAVTAAKPPHGNPSCKARATSAGAAIGRI